MTLHEFAECIAGWNLAHGVEPEPEPPSPEEHLAMARRFAEMTKRAGG